MEELLQIKMENDRITLSARELYEFLELEERFSKWFERMTGYGFEEDVEYTPYQKVHPQNKQELQDYQLTIEMAKEIAMLQRNEKGKQARQYFIELEKEWNSPEKVVARGLIASQKIISSLTLKIQEMKPKADFYDSVADSKTAIPMDQVAKVLNIHGVGRNKLFDLLRGKGILQHNNIPYQTFVDRGYFRVVESKFTKPSGETCISIKTLVYQKGVDYISRIINKH